MTDPLPRPEMNPADSANRLSHAQRRQSAPIGSAAEQPKAIELRKACSEFESVFIAFLLKEMRATVDKSGLIDGGKSEQLYESMMDAQLARKIASTGGFGLAKMLYEQLRGPTAGDSGGSGEQTTDAARASSQKPVKFR